MSPAAVLEPEIDTMPLSFTRTCAILLGTSLAGVIAAGTAGAKDFSYRKSLKKDTEVRLIPHSSFRGECETKKAEIKILNEPENGTAKVKSGPRKFPKGGKGRMAKCDGKTGVASAIFYKPKSGFEGFDKLRYEVTFASGNKNVYEFRLRIGAPKGKDDGKGWVKPN
ncbi:MAG: hypothetical protein NWT00_03470 [Beijerinckiaceae bacterium]|nr:hypothetical protein [Beijerinckiaceae bacterium]